MTTSADADVIVVGGGPAGAATALLLARRGRAVVLIDRAVFPRPKPCGDCLSAGATALLRRLGVLDAALARPHAVLQGWRIVAPDGALFEARFPGEAGTALVVERAELDDALLVAARAAGVTVEHDRVVDIVRRGGAVIGVRGLRRSWHAPLVIGADGLRSVVAARLGLRQRGPLRKLSLTFHLDAAPDNDAMGEMHVGDGFCAGLAPVSSTRCNLTLVADAARFGRAVADDPATIAAVLIARLPRLAHRIAPDALHNSAPRASGPFDRPVSRIAVDGAALVGDAAGYYDPFTGQGVYQALASAELLAACADAALGLHPGGVAAAALQPYVRARTRLLRGARLVQRGIETVLSRPALANRAIAHIGRAPAFGRALIAVTGDVQPPSRLFAPRPLLDLVIPLPELT